MFLLEACSYEKGTSVVDAHKLTVMTVEYSSGAPLGVNAKIKWTDIAK